MNKKLQRAFNAMLLGTIFGGEDFWNKEAQEQPKIILRKCLLSGCEKEVKKKNALFCCAEHSKQFDLLKKV